jgi:hypothetical protein
MNDRTRCWLFFAREGKGGHDYARECYAGEVAAIGWSEHENVIPLDESALRRYVERHYPEELKNGFQCLRTFINEVMGEDYVIMPHRESEAVFVGQFKQNGLIWVKKPGFAKWYRLRRKVKWLLEVDRRDLARRLGVDNRLGGVNTISEAHAVSVAKLKRLIEQSGKPRDPVNSMPAHPDAGWGRAGEERMLKLLRSEGLDPRDVAHLCRGWDIECESLFYEVKTRHSDRAQVILTANEHRKALTMRRKYVLAVFTANSYKTLEMAKPRLTHDPARSLNWQEKQNPVYQYTV